MTNPREEAIKMGKEWRLWTREQFVATLEWEDTVLPKLTSMATKEVSLSALKRAFFKSMRTRDEDSD